MKTFLPNVDVPELDLREQNFIAELSRAANLTEAAVRAGYAKSGALKTAKSLLDKPYIQEAIRAYYESSAMSANAVMANISDIAASNIGDYLKINDDGSFQFDLKMAHEERKLHRVRKIKKTKTTYRDRSGGVKEEETVELELYDRQKALDQLARIYGLYNQQSTVDEIDERIRNMVRSGGITFEELTIRVNVEYATNIFAGLGIPIDSEHGQSQKQLEESLSDDNQEIRVLGPDSNSERNSKENIDEE